MTADVRIGVRLDDHGHGVPAHNALDAAFDIAVTRILRLFFRPDGIDVRRGASSDRPRGGTELARKLFEQLRRALRPVAFKGMFEDGLKGFVELIPIAAAVGCRCGKAAARAVNFFFRCFH